MMEDVDIEIWIKNVLNWIEDWRDSSGYDEKDFENSKGLIGNIETRLEVLLERMGED
jgi:hypothetical protein